MAGENSLTSQFQKAFQDMTTTQKVMVAAITLTVFLVLAGIGVWANQEQMGVLFSNLPPTEANRIVEELRKTNTSFELSQDQRTVSVPKEKVGELRLKFAGEGLPKGEGIGFEKLEAPSLTTTDFVQKVQYRRAMESELAKTIMTLQQVANASVHITPGSDSPFITDKEDAKASVVLRLKGSRILPEENTQAIVNLVAASVEGLKPERVVVVDQNSRILSRTGQDPLVGASETQKKAQREEEDHLARSVVDLLEPVVGMGKVRVSARVELDFDKVKLNSETYDPQGQVERETQVMEEKSEKREGTSGVPGTPSNVAPAAASANGSSMDKVEKKDTKTHYEISKTLKSVDQAVGSVKRVSLAVVVDHATLWEKDAKGNPLEKLVPRTPEELKKLRDQVAAAVGVQAKRGDELIVENMPFASLVNPKEEAEARNQMLWSAGMKAAPVAAYLIAGLVVFFFIVLPLLRRVSSALNKPVPLRVQLGGEEGPAAPRKFTQAKSMAELESEIEAELNAEGASGAPEVQRRAAIKKRIQESSAADPETVASLVRSWMIEDTGR